MDSDLIRTFLAVVRCRSFVAAAEQVHRSQAAVSQQIQRLEAQLGGQLLLRSSREVRLTAAGERFLDYAQRLLALGEEAGAAVQGLVRPRRLRLGVVEDVAAFKLAELLRRLAEAAPDLQLELDSAATRELLPQLGIRYDAVLGMAPAGQHAGRELARLPLRWLGEWDGAGALPLALHPDGCSIRRLSIAALDTAGRPWRTVIVASGVAATLAAARAGLAVTVLADGLAPADLPRPSGLPELPAMAITLHQSEDADAEAIELLARLSREVLAG
ncbi:LysR family transcriptional regulator [Neisseriaceae bacterium JH1-16]|nr:LysR family transcriptional regulator [Neisseriaceae bacterium JH1-16]